jgi:hypothetical protein
VNPECLLGSPFTCFFNVGGFEADAKVPPFIVNPDSQMPI